ncbi:MAG: hypothetical protein ACRDZS_05310 [Acidimicrobiales bacterium]
MPLPATVIEAAGVSGRRTQLAVLHEVKCLLPCHVTVLDAIPIVRPERLALELCACEHPLRAGRAVDDMWRRRLWSGRSLRRFIQEASVQGRPGLQALRAALRDAGFEVVEITEDQVWHRPDEVVRVIEKARRTCGLG